MAITFKPIFNSVKLVPVLYELSAVPDVILKLTVAPGSKSISLFSSLSKLVPFHSAEPLFKSIVALKDSVAFVWSVFFSVIVAVPCAPPFFALLTPIVKPLSSSVGPTKLPCQLVSQASALLPLSNAYVTVKPATPGLILPVAVLLVAYVLGLFSTSTVSSDVSTADTGPVSSSARTVGTHSPASKQRVSSHAAPRVHSRFLFIEVFLLAVRFPSVCRGRFPAPVRSS